MSGDEEILPGVRVKTEDSTNHHWVGSCGTLVIILLKDGSQADPTHVLAGQRALARLTRQGHPVHQLLVVWPPTLGKPPTAEVRRAILDAAPYARAIDRASGVLLGTGFLPAMHRSTVTGIVALVRPRIQLRIMGTLAEALAHVVPDDVPRAEALTRFCEDLVARSIDADPRASSGPA